MHLALLTTVLYLGLVSACRKDPPQDVPCPATTAGDTVQSVTCVRDKKEVECSLPSQPGTVATSSCRTGYYTPGKHTPKTATCRADGTWSNSGEKCVKLECGQQNVVKKMIGGEEVQEGELPWNVNIYLGRFGLFGLGTLITPTHVLTAANCVTSNGKLQPASDFKLTAGKHIRRYLNEPREPNAEWRDVKTVIAHEQYGGYGGVHDIAILVANQSFDLTGAVNVACLDWSGMFNEPHLDYNNLKAAASVTGKTDREYPQYLPQSYRWLSRTYCKLLVKEEKRKYVTQDGFCGQTFGDTCDERHGAGLVVREDTTMSYYLLGVSSLRFLGSISSECGAGREISFTNVTMHLPWIRQQLDGST